MEFIPISNESDECVGLPFCNTIKSKSSTNGKTCIICDEDVENLNVFCGNEKCKARACNTCMIKFHAQNEYGRLVLKSSMHCMLCRSLISGKIMTEWNNVCADKEVKFNDEYYYALCITCKEIKTYGARRCMFGLPRARDFECVDCTKQHKIVHCPSCKIQTIRSDGCNHMTCVCGIHYCYLCNNRGYKTIDDVASHFRAVHGGDYFTTFTAPCPPPSRILTHSMRTLRSFSHASPLYVMIQLYIGIYLHKDHKMPVKNIMVAGVIANIVNFGIHGLSGYFHDLLEYFW
jgi:hypothetical protein